MRQFTIHGTRGTMTVDGASFARYGRQTTCFSLETDDGLIVIDAGTGITDLSTRLGAGAEGRPITLLFTHFHLDHVIGLPLFQPLYDPNARLTLMADPRRKREWKAALRTLVGPPYWPVPLQDCGATLDLRDLPDSGSLSLYGVDIAWLPVRHPQQCLAYRLRLPQGTIIVATDREHGIPARDAAFRDFCRGADALIYDAQYTEADYPGHEGWGHSTWPEGVRVAAKAGARRLLLTHHDRDRTDDALDRIEAEAARAFPGARCAREGMVLRPVAGRLELADAEGA